MFISLGLLADLLECPTTPSESSGSFKCQSTGKFPHNSDCHKFYICFGEIQGNMTCGGDQVFDKVFLRCSDDFALCPTTPKCQNHMQRLRDPHDSRRYFICIRSRNWRRLSAYRRSCRTDEVFDSQKVKCTHVDKGKRSSGDSTSTEEVLDSDEVNTEESNENTDFKCKAEGKFADAKNRRKYYVCEKQCNGTYRRLHNTCAEGKVFDSRKVTCVRRRKD